MHYLKPHLQLVAINISNSQENCKLVIGLINYKSDWQNSLISLSAIKTYTRLGICIALDVVRRRPRPVAKPACWLVHNTGIFERLAVAY